MTTVAGVPPFHSTETHAQRSLSAARETASARDGITDKASTLARVRCKALLDVIYCSAAGDAFALAVELHRAPADGEVAAALSCLMSAAVREAGLSLPPSVTASFGCVRITDAGWTSSFIACAPDIRSRVRPEIQHGEIRLVKFVHDRLHLGMNAGVAREVGGEPVGELDDEAGGGAVSEDGAVGFQVCGCASESRAGGTLFACEAYTMVISTPCDASAPSR